MNREQSPSALHCHHEILVASIAVAPTPGRESARAILLWETGRVNRIAPERRHRLTTMATSSIMWNTRGIYPCLNRPVCLLMGSSNWWRFSFCSSGSSLVCSMMTWRNARAQILNVRSPMLTMGFPLISGPSNALLWNLINHVTITFRDVFSSTNLYYSNFTRPLLHAVYNTWLTPVTACGSQSTASGIEMRRGQLRIGVNCIFPGKFCNQNW